MDKYEKLIKAVFYCNRDEVISLMRSHTYSKTWLDDIGLFCAPFPLYYISLCIKTILADIDISWKEDFEPIRAKLLAGCGYLRIYELRKWL